MPSKPEKPSNRDVPRPEPGEVMRDEMLRGRRARTPLNAEPALTNAELVQLQVRVVALENLVIALLADCSESRRALADQMAIHISPRTGYTRHRLTLHAAGHMKHLLERARYFRAIPTDGRGT